MFDPILLIVLALLGPGFVLLIGIVVSFVIRKRDSELGPIVTHYVPENPTTASNDVAK